MNSSQCVKQSPAKFKAMSWDTQLKKALNGNIDIAWPVVVVLCPVAVIAECMRSRSAALGGVQQW